MYASEQRVIASAEMSVMTVNKNAFDFMRNIIADIDTTSVTSTYPFFRFRFRWRNNRTELLKNKYVPIETEPKMANMATNNAFPEKSPVNNRDERTYPPMIRNVPSNPLPIVHPVNLRVLSSVDDDSEKSDTIVCLRMNI